MTTTADYYVGLALEAKAMADRAQAMHTSIVGCFAHRCDAAESLDSLSRTATLRAGQALVKKAQGR